MFFKLINHRVSNTLIEKMQGTVMGSSNSPRKRKRNTGRLTKEWGALSKAFVISEEQKHVWVDLFFLATLPPSQSDAGANMLDLVFLFFLL